MLLAEYFMFSVKLWQLEDGASEWLYMYCCTLELVAVRSPSESHEWDQDKPKHTVDMDVLFFFVMVLAHNSLQQNLSGN